MAKKNSEVLRVPPELKKLLKSYKMYQSQKSGMNVSMMESMRKFAKEAEKALSNKRKALFIIEK